MPTPPLPRPSWATSSVLDHDVVVHSRRVTAPVELTNEYDQDPDPQHPAELAVHVLDLLGLDGAGQLVSERGRPWVSVLDCALAPDQARVLRDGLSELLDALERAR